MEEEEPVVDPSSLYIVGTLSVFANGDVLLDRTPVAVQEKDPLKFHTVEKGDLIGGIAWKQYKDFVPNPEKWYWLIVDANNITNPLDLSEFIGIDLIIPNVLTNKLRL